MYNLLLQTFNAGHCKVLMEQKKQNLTSQFSNRLLLTCTAPYQQSNAPSFSRFFSTQLTLVHCFLIYIQIHVAVLLLMPVIPMLQSFTCNPLCICYELVGLQHAQLCIKTSVYCLTALYKNNYSYLDFPTTLWCQLQYSDYSISSIISYQKLGGAIQILFVFIQNSMLPIISMVVVLCCVFYVRSV